MHTTHHKVDLNTIDVTAPPVLKKYSGPAMVAAAIGVIGLVVGIFLNFTQVLHAYLIGYMLFIGLTLGPIGFVFIWYTTGGRWGLPMRRIWEAGSRNIIAAAVLFLPIAIWHSRIYPWAHPEAYANNANVTRLIHHYLNPTGFVLRAVLYFLCFFVIIWLSDHFSKIQDRPHVEYLGHKLNGLGGVGIVVYFFAMSFAGIDWVMSLQPAWPSTIWAMNLIVGQGILALSVGIIMATILVKFEPMSDFMTEVMFHDNGKLLFAFIMLWAYTAFSQWLVIWSGNLPDEISFYLVRLRGGWQYASLFLALFHFCVPFAILLSASLKKRPEQLIWVAGWMIVMRWWDLFWNIEGAYHPGDFRGALNWMDIVIPIGMVGVWTALFLRNYMARPILPLYDPHTPVQVETEHE